MNSPTDEGVAEPRPAQEAPSPSPIPARVASPDGSASASRTRPRREGVAGRAAEHRPRVDPATSRSADGGTAEQPRERRGRTGRAGRAGGLAGVPAEHGVADARDAPDRASERTTAARPRHAAAPVGAPAKRPDADRAVRGAGVVRAGSPQRRIGSRRRLGPARPGPVGGPVEAATRAGDPARTRRERGRGRAGPGPGAVARAEAGRAAAGGGRGSPARGPVAPG